MGQACVYYVMLIKRPDGSVVGSQVNAHTGTSRQIRVFLGHGGARSQAAHTLAGVRPRIGCLHMLGCRPWLGTHTGTCTGRGETVDWLLAHARV